MPESTSILPAPRISPQRLPIFLGKDNLLSLIESLLDPCVLAASLLLIAVGIDGEVLPPYMILSVMVFAVTYPGASRIQTSFARLPSRCLPKM